MGAGTMAGAAAPGEHAWQRGRAPWDAYFGLVLIATLVIVRLDDVPAVERDVASVLLALLVPVYVLLCRPALSLDRPSRLGMCYVAICGVMVATSATVDQATWFVLFAVVPQIFMLLPPRGAAIVVVMMNVAPALWLLSDQSLQAGVAFGAIATIVTAFSVVFSVWIQRIVVQSRERAELIEQLEAARVELAAAHHEAGMLAERQRLSGEIHDTLAQGFTSILMLLQAAEPHVGEAQRPLEMAARTARENLAEARALVAALAPPPLAMARLSEAVRRLTERLDEEIDATASYEISGTPRSLAPATEVVLLRATQEALANARKHACARSVTVRVEYGDDSVRLEVRDDGVGFTAPPTDTGSGERWGLRGMRERVGQVGGTVTIDSSPGHGTTLTVEVPA